jgi:hypothetical protein
LDNFIKATDSNNDNVVTRDEFRVAVEKIVAGGPANLPGTKKERKKEKVIEYHMHICFMNKTLVHPYKNIGLRVKCDHITRTIALTKNKIATFKNKWKYIGSSESWILVVDFGFLVRTLNLKLSPKVQLANNPNLTSTDF